MPPDFLQPLTSQRPFHSAYGQAGTDRGSDETVSKLGLTLLGFIGYKYHLAIYYLSFASLLTSSLSIYLGTLVCPLEGSYCLIAPIKDTSYWENRVFHQLVCHLTLFLSLFCHTEFKVRVSNREARTGSFHKP